MSNPNIYDIGDLVKLTGTFTDENGAAADPTTIALYIKPPSGTLITKTYALAELTKASTGVYTYNLSITLSGSYWYRWVGTGAIQTAGENSLVVRELHTI